MTPIVLAVIVSLKLCTGMLYEKECKGDIFDLEKSCLDVQCVHDEAGQIYKYWYYMAPYEKDIENEN